MGDGQERRRQNESTVGNRRQRGEPDLGDWRVKTRGEKWWKANEIMTRLRRIQLL